MNDFQFESAYKPIEFSTVKTVFYQKPLGYVPIVLVDVERKSIETEFPHFAVCQTYLDEFMQWHNYFDRFLLHIESCNVNDFNFHYRVMDHTMKVIEEGRII